MTVRSINARLTLVSLAVAAFVLITWAIFQQVLFFNAVGEGQRQALALVERFVQHPQYQTALETMPTDLRSSFAELRTQLNQSAELAGFLLKWRGLFILGFLAVLTPLVITVSLFVTRRLTFPIRSVATSARSLAQGDLGARAHPDPVSWDTDSLALAHDFNRMAASLERLELERQNMIADVAHELRTPLTGMQLHLEALTDGVEPLTPESIRELYDDTRLLSRLIIDLRTLSLAEAKQLSLELADIDLYLLAQKTLARFRVQAQQGSVDLMLDAQPGICLCADAERLEQTLSNLLSNALRHTPPGGSVTVALKRQDRWLNVSVLDTGPGLSDETLTHLFNRFYRSKGGLVRAEGSSGLGLAIVKALTELQGGTISAQNRPEGGAAFHLRFQESTQVGDHARLDSTSTVSDLSSNS